MRFPNAPRRSGFGWRWISSLDPTAYLAAIAVFLVTIAMAAVLPARKALSIDPLRALRHE
jgi:ABC-type antimicrobial peptide transport system permease subunit